MHTSQKNRFGSTLLADKDLYRVNRCDKCIDLTATHIESGSRKVSELGKK